jgi:hypothetical protein
MAGDAPKLICPLQQSSRTVLKRVIGVATMADAPHQIEQDVGAALECAEAATWSANELVGRTLETAVTGKEAATTLHHAYSAQVHVARVLEWSNEWALSRELALSPSPPSKLGDCLSRYCNVSVVMADGRVSRINYTGPTGGALTGGEQCAFAVQNCTH